MKLSQATGQHSQFATLQYRTILWIGTREANEVRVAYETAELCSSQLAYRPSLASAIDRPASDVDMIIVAASDRTSLSQWQLEELNRRHPSATRLLLRSSLCSGVRIAGDSFFSEHRHNWIVATEVLKEILGSKKPNCDSANCVAVIASNFAAAETLLQIAEDSGCSAFWCRSERTLAARGINAVWWDDSFAVPTDTSGWQKRIAAMSACSGKNNPTHTWITNRVHWLQVQQAREAGIGLVLTKPFPLELLSESLAQASQAKPDQHLTIDDKAQISEAA